MSSWDITAPAEEKPIRRVREEVRDGVAVVCVSALASSSVAIVLTLVTKLVG